MTPDKIRSVVITYQAELTERGITPQRIDTQKKFADYSEEEVLAHAAHLCCNIIDFLDDPAEWDKLNRHLGALQMCLSFAGCYSLDELRAHNRPTI